MLLWSSREAGCKLRRTEPGGQADGRREQDATAHQAGARRGQTRPGVRESPRASRGANEADAGGSRCRPHEARRPGRHAPQRNLSWSRANGGTGGRRRVAHRAAAEPTSRPCGAH